MKGDFSRRTFDSADHYSAVLFEQGRMLTDADLDEEHRILIHRIETGALSLIGGCGGPIGSAGFEITAAVAGDLQIGSGRYYVDGILVENDGAFTYLNQPDRHGTVFTAVAGRYLAYLDVWRRLITALDDPTIREVALGGPTTSAREYTVWQVRLIAVPAGATCADPGADFDDPTGQLAARAVPEATTAGPCIVPPGAGYRGLENQLYRVEIHDSGNAYDLTAAPNVFDIVAFPAGTTNRIVVDDGDPWVVGEAVEVFRAAAGFDPLDGTLAFIAAVEDGGNATSILVLNTDLPAFAPGDLPRVRRVDATFVWSRDNGSVVTTIERIDNDEIAVRDLGPDEVLGFGPGQWVEIIDDRLELEGQPGELARIAAIDVARRIVTLQSAVQPLANPADGSGVDQALHPKLRRWDGVGAVRTANPVPNDDWIELESGVQVRFDAGDYRTGDYWHFPARTATAGVGAGNVEWPGDPANPDLVAPHGITHHRCPLAILDIDAAGAVEVVSDCRNLFPPVTQLTNLLYVGGDGQEGMPNPLDQDAQDVALGDDLRVRVANGGVPVEGAEVLFTIAAGNGQLEGTGLPEARLTTDPNGIASCTWQLDGTVQHQICEARLLDSAGNPLAGQFVRFHANLSTAEAVSYDPTKTNCPSLAGITTVQDAIDALCAREGPGGGCCCVVVGKEGEFQTIDEAVRKLLESGQSDICLCLLPGDHDMSGLELRIEDFRRGVHLSISGCGSATRVRFRERMRLIGWASVTLKEFDIFCEPSVAIEFLHCSRVRIDACRIFGAGVKQSLVLVDGAAHVYVGNTTLEVLRDTDFDPLREILSGLDLVLDALFQLRQWDAEGRIREAAIDLAARDPAELIDIGNAIRERTTQLRRRLSVGEAEAFLRLAFSLFQQPAVVPTIIDHLHAIRTALARATPAVALEIGWIGPDGEVPGDSGLMRDAAVIVENNSIAGAVSFYGPPNLDWTIPPVPLRNLRNGVKNRKIVLTGVSGMVQLRGNRLTRLLVSDELVSQLEHFGDDGSGTLDVLLETFVCSDNVIDGAGHILVARHCSVGMNDFTLDAVRNLVNADNHPNDLPLNVIAGDTLVATGNHGRALEAQGQLVGVVAFNAITRVAVETANLEITFT